MNEFKGTPGPWFAVIASDGETYISTSNAGFDGYTIAMMLGGDGDDAMDFNADLIKAAPALLEALEALSVAYERRMDDEENATWHDEYNQARAAIAAALGEEGKSS